MYPYPSGDLHIGHWYIVTPTDAIGRYQRMKGYNVFFPIGFDAFGLPAENAAIKQRHPSARVDVREHRQHAPPVPDDGRRASTGTRRSSPPTRRTTAGTSGSSCSSSRTGLAYRQMAPVDWCPKDLVVLAREQVLGADRVCWRCGTPVIKRDLEQWFFRITDVRRRAAELRRPGLARADQGRCRPTGSAASKAPR